MDNEIWKGIEGYPDYQVSNLGRVKSLSRKHKVLKGFVIPEKILKPVVRKNSGYGYVTIFKNGVSKPIAIHRLVAMAFIPNPYNYKVVNHKDEIKSNNCADNLEWCTSHYNFNYGTCRERANAKNRKRILMSLPNGRQIAEWASPTDAAHALRFDEEFIAKAARGETDMAYGYIWKYK